MSIMQRFFLTEDAFQGEVIYFPEDISHQISRVLRMKPGDQVVAINPLGKEYHLTLQDVNPKICIGKVDSVQAAMGEPTLQLDLYVALTQREKFEWILQKCTEVGVSSITPVVTERSLVFNQQSVDKKQERWQKILKEAAEQSQRGRVPDLKETLDYETVCSQVRADRRLIAWVGETSQNLKAALGDGSVNQLALLIGPEGGFSTKEIQTAIASGWSPFTMGKRVLRMETAAVVACALIFYESEEMGA
ncbi:MAG: 16S rRNA (uracil(1498)-N(3))-methyltransferase [Anaerolineaceae bacterium]|nr:16S rRNA (uracil(1498)-N(3))-methyltransferase [Anaerolineaceae bacterium]